MKRHDVWGEVRGLLSIHLKNDVIMDELASRLIQYFEINHGIRFDELTGIRFDKNENPPRSQI